MYVNGYIVETHRTDNGELLVNVSYVKPGARISSPEWEKTVFILEKTKRFFDYPGTIAEYIASLSIPYGGYAKIEI